MVRVFITGSSTGLGLAAAQSLLAGGHDVVLHARNAESAAALTAEVQQALTIVTGDLSLLSETRGVADAVNAIGHMDAVIHNAGLFGAKGGGRTAEGHSVMTAVNLLAPYVLTACINRPGRLVYMSSGLHRDGNAGLDDLDWTRRKWRPDQAYADTKFQIVALALTVARCWPGVLSNAVDPGWVRTRMGGAGAPVDIPTGQATQSWLAASDDEAARTSGGYWHAMQREAPVVPAACADHGDRLLAALHALTGVTIGNDV